MSDASPHRTPKPCPTCGKPADPLHRPFCSKRCADIDLHRWFSEGYRLPAAEEPGDDEDTAPR